MTNSILCIDKPLGISSMAAISRVRKTLELEKIGHSGTLDPAASGLLVVATGLATRLFPYLMLEPKIYVFSIIFGACTDTLDSEGTIVEKDGTIPSEACLLDAISGFRGEIEQQPPAFSALKINGKRAYSLARKKQEFTLPLRRISIFRLSLESYSVHKGEAMLEVVCSGGTYVRSLARDIAISLGTFGYAGFIRRKAIGLLSVDGAPAPDSNADVLRNAMRPLADILSGEAVYTASDSQITEISHGRNISIETHENSKTVFVFNSNGDIAAVMKPVSPGLFHPEKVFI